MKKKVFVLVLLFVFLSFITVYALSNNFNLDISNFSFTTGKNKNIFDSFNKDYSINYSSSYNDIELEQEIKKLAKEETYLLLGGINNVNESSEHYYKRHQDWLNQIYEVTVPKNEKGEEDKNSPEYIYDVFAGTVLTSLFPEFQEAGIIYNSYGNIIVSKSKNYVIATMTLPNVKIKEENKEEPMKYDYVETNYYIYYYFIKLDGKYRLFYLYGLDSSEMNDYFDGIASEEDKKSMAMNPISYDDGLSKIYNLDKLKKLSKEKISSVYNKTYKNMTFLNSYYNNQVISSSNGFFITDNLIVTTWDFVHKSLLNAQYIVITSDGKTLDIEGVVTANIDNDIAVIKVKNGNSSITLGDYKRIEKEDPVIMISSKLGTGLNMQTGIIISNDSNFQTTIPVSSVDAGSPIMNEDGEVIGMASSKNVNSSISIITNSEVLKEIKSKLENAKDVTFITFDELKTKYYYLKYDNEKVINSIPKTKWKKFSKIGDISNAIKLNLVKASYANDIVSLRYKNEVKDFVSSMQFAAAFREKLSNDGYKLITNSDSKEIYQNKKYKVIIMDEFDYLIIVMVKL